MSLSESSSAYPKQHLYGRRKGRPLHKRKSRLMQELLPQWEITLGGNAPLDPFELFDVRPVSIALEIGFGGGEHLAAQAARRPESLLLGAEPFLNGVASALRHLQEARLANVRLHAGDARDLMACLPDACLDRVFILFPDPWPKLRHNKRRLIQPDFVAEAARLLKAGGRLRFATDWADYADQALATLRRSAHFEWLAEQAADWSRPPADHVTTRYEEKKLGDCAPIWLEFRRL